MSALRNCWTAVQEARGARRLLDRRHSVHPHRGDRQGWPDARGFIL